MVCVQILADVAARELSGEFASRLRGLGHSVEARELHSFPIADPLPALLISSAKACDVLLVAVSLGSPRRDWLLAELAHAELYPSVLLAVASEAEAPEWAHDSERICVATRPELPRILGHAPMPVRVLFVENHVAFARTVVEQFLSGYEVVVLPSVQAALAEASTTDFDAILVDYDLDDLKGDELVRRLREAGSSVPIVAVSAHAIGNNALISAGADEACPKLEFSNIERVLARVARRRGGTG